MANLQTRLQNALVRVATEHKALRTLINGNSADLAALSTTAKGNIVLALNELKGLVDAIGTPATINDASNASATQTWSITKIASEITSAINSLTTGAPGALNTLDELAAALGDDANFAATITAALANRVRTDTAVQGLTLQQQQNARSNIAAYGPVELGNPDADLVAVFEAALA